ncbi:HNH endonuclease [Arthrobacter sp. I2-34]|uniref:HNH endonuclease n=1 Tax=Arthrobacter hankyongi TaxID=2904801 RepID=A0ABS9L9X9_9MICC|nr:HNH endonuclease signature motif containing protein [Arthrobacter hankyongi]MCG2623492.1 HNH endonuclease [Arthrobacter hankyongi]
MSTIPDYDADGIPVDPDRDWLAEVRAVWDDRDTALPNGEDPDDCDVPGPDEDVFWGGDPVFPGPDDGDSCPGPEAAWLGTLASPAPEQLSYNEAAARLKQAGRSAARLEALICRLASRLHAQAVAERPEGWPARLRPEGLHPGTGFGECAVVEEIACALRIPRQSAAARLDLSLKLTGGFTGTQAALERGDTTLALADVIIGQAGSIPPEAWKDFEQCLLPAATMDDMNRPKLADRARRLRERRHPESATVRRAKAVGGRRVELHPDQDGMAWLKAYLPVEDAVAAFNRIRSTAASLQGPDEPRTLTQLCADVAADLLLTGTTDGPRMGRPGPRIAAHVNLTVPMLTLIGQGGEPAELEGYGPVAPDVARRLCADAPSFTRFLTDPVRPEVLAMDRTRYRPTRAQRRFLRQRDRTCRAAGCNRAAIHCEADHTCPWSQGGRTDVDRMCCFCKLHHALKTAGYCSAEQPSPGTIVWTTAGGQRYSGGPEPPVVTQPDELATILERHQIEDLNRLLKTHWDKLHPLRPPDAHVTHNGYPTDLTPPPF